MTQVAPGHGQNRNGPNSAKKKGGNKGIAAARKERKRLEAEARNGERWPNGEPRL